MKRLILTVLLALLGATALRAANEGETTLFDSRGDAHAYIDYSRQMTIYLWSGEPVAYLDQKEGGIFDVWGLNGRHLGWFSDGYLRDSQGFVVGAVKENFKSELRPEAAKMAKRPTPPKASQEISPFPARARMEWAKDGSIRSFLLRGKYE